MHQSIKVTHHHFNALRWGDRIPRKAKKAILGLKISSCALNRLLKSVKVLETFKTMYETPNIYPYLFCHKCGHTGYYGTGNMTEYPEHWEDFNCFRCHAKVAYIDNSPFVHILEFAKDGVVNDKYF